MPKWGIGLISGSVITGLLLILFGRMVYPHLSLSHDIAWVILAGTAAGGLSGLIMYILDLSFGGGVLSGIGSGALLFFIISLILHGALFSSVLLGAAAGGLSGLTVHIWPILNAPGRENSR